MLRYRTVLLAQSGICSGSHPIGIEEYITGFINKCIDDVVPTATRRTLPNQKPWITGNIRTKLKARAAAFKERDTVPNTYKKSRYALRRTINHAKLCHLFDVAGIENDYGLQMETPPRAAQWPEPTRWSKCLLFSLWGKQHWSMHESTSCSGRLCDHALRSRCEQDLLTWLGNAFR